ncbi:hypothetical protein G6F40_016620 [Rhizopus arrhizus]|nr:hypothetical protein G6F40_016620 [Rhizopus arrhizus]
MAIGDGDEGAMRVAQPLRGIAVQPQHCLQPGIAGAGGVHQARALRRQCQAGGGVDAAGDGVRGELADAVARDHRRRRQHLAQALPVRQAGCAQQRLRLHIVETVVGRRSGEHIAAQQFTGGIEQWLAGPGS